MVYKKSNFIEGTRGNYLGQACSSSGQYVISCSETRLLVSNNYGETFTPLPIINCSWNKVACSSTGEYMVATSIGNGVWLSNDFGVNFNVISSTSSAISWKGVAISSSGQYISVCSDVGLYISSNYGQTLPVSSSVDITNKTYRTSVSSTGQYIIASSNPVGYVWVSNDFGATFINPTGLSSSLWGITAMSGDGKYIYVAEYNGALYKSSDFGVIFSPVVVGSSIVLGRWNLLNVNSLSGRYVLAGVMGSNLYLSTDYGLSFQSTILTGEQWIGGSMSGDGDTMIVPSIGGRVYASFDSGTTFDTLLPQSIYSRSSCSLDGKYITIASTTSILYSTDGGSMFSNSTYSGTICGNWVNSVQNATGQYILLSDSDGVNLWVSSDSGNNFVQSDINENFNGANVTWSDMCMSQNGKYMMASTFFKGDVLVAPTLLISSDYGLNFTVQSDITTLDGGTSNCCIGADGNTMIFATSFNIWISKDSGQFFTSTELTSGSLYSVACNYDASIIVTCDLFNLYLSTDGGNTFTNKLTLSPQDETFYSVCASGTGQFIVAVGFYAYISNNSGASFTKINSVLVGSYEFVSISSDGACIIFIESETNKILFSRDYGTSFTTSSSLSGILNDTSISFNGRTSLVNYSLGGQITSDYGNSFTTFPSQNGKVQPVSVSGNENTVFFAQFSGNALFSSIPITDSKIIITLVKGVTPSSNPFQPFSITGTPTGNIKIYLPSKVEVGVPPVEYVNPSAYDGVFKITSSSSIEGIYSYDCIIDDGDRSILHSFLINVVSQATYDSLQKTTFYFANQYPTNPTNQAGLWNATVNAIAEKNSSAVIRDLTQSSGSVVNNVVSNIPITTNGLTFVYDGDTYTQSAVPCLLSFSKILMADGTKKPISEIEEGQEVISALTHKPTKVKAIRSRIVDYRALNHENHIRVIPKDFFGENSPSRDLYISGLHCVLLKVADTTGLPRNRLSFQARRLSNNFKILDADEIRKLTDQNEILYYHIDLDGLDAVYCEDVPVESYYREN